MYHRLVKKYIKGWRFRNTVYLTRSLQMTNSVCKLKQKIRHFDAMHSLVMSSYVKWDISGAWGQLRLDCLPDKPPMTHTVTAGLKPRSAGWKSSEIIYRAAAAILTTKAINCKYRGFVFVEWSSSRVVEMSRSRELTVNNSKWLRDVHFFPAQQIHTDKNLPTCIHVHKW